MALSRSLWLGPDGWSVEILDQTLLPQRAEPVRLSTLDAVVEAIVTMQVRGAPLIGIAAAYGICLALMTDDSDSSLDDAAAALLATRPTAVNLSHAVARMVGAVQPLPHSDRAAAAYREAAAMLEEEVTSCHAIGAHGVALLRELAGSRSGPVRVLTHCNAGWLATVEYGTALAPVYLAHAEGIAVQVWVDETRPRSQGWLTAWELGAAGVPHTVIADTMAGHLLQRGEVDLVLVGTDRTTRTGDVCNKIGTYGVALAAAEAGVPFYAAVPGSSIDWETTDWRQIPIEERAADEVCTMRGTSAEGQPARITLGTGAEAVRNPAFDVTPARLVTGLITERGLCRASRRGLLALYPERRR